MTSPPNNNSEPILGSLPLSSNNTANVINSNQHNRQLINIHHGKILSPNYILNETCNKNSNVLLPENKNVPKCFENVLSHSSPLKCRIHPVVIFSVLDAYIRREDDQNYVIGTLMGIITEINTLEITDCFVDRHSLTDEGLLQIVKDHHESMYELKQKVNPKEHVVGWFCTGNEMTELTCAVHGWFKQFNNVSKFNPQSSSLTEPIHLMIDTTLKNSNLSIKAFVQLPLFLVKDSCFHFQQIPIEILSSDKGGISLLLRSCNSLRRFGLNGYKDLESISPSKDDFESSLEKFLDLLLICLEYVENVLQNNIQPDVGIGRFLSKTLSHDVLSDMEKFYIICQNLLQDNLMVSYLASLAQLQFALAEKLNTSFF